MKKSKVLELIHLKPAIYKKGNELYIVTGVSKDGKTIQMKIVKVEEKK